MKCPKCGKKNSKVLQTINLTTVIVRRRKCMECGMTFTTTEKVEIHEDTKEAPAGNRSAAQ